MDRGWRLGMLAVLAMAPFGLVACDEGDDDEPVTQAAYDEEAARLCGRFGADVVRLSDETTGASPDAELINRLVAEFVPAMRSIVQSLDGFGFPADKAPQYGNAAAVALHVLNQIEADAPELVDRLTAGTMTEEENPFVDLDQALVALDVPC